MLTTPGLNNKAAKKEAPCLPQDPVQAVHTIMRLSRKIIDVVERESQSLAMDDMIGFGALQDYKHALSLEYQQICGEFHTRLEEFRRVDPALMNQMDKLQHEIGERSRHNNKIIQKIRERATKKTQTTLYEAQEIAQNTHIVFPPKNTANQQESKGA